MTREQETEVFTSAAFANICCGNPKDMFTTWDETTTEGVLTSVSKTEALEYVMRNTRAIENASERAIEKIAEATVHAS